MRGGGGYLRCMSRGEVRITTQRLFDANLLSLIVRAPRTVPPYVERPAHGTSGPRSSLPQGANLGLLPDHHAVSQSSPGPGARSHSRGQSEAYLRFKARGGALVRRGAQLYGG